MAYTNIVDTISVPVVTVSYFWPKGILCSFVKQGWYVEFGHRNRRPHSPLNFPKARCTYKEPKMENDTTSPSEGQFFDAAEK